MQKGFSGRNLLRNQIVLIIEPTLNYKNSMKGFLSNLKIPKFKIVSNIRDAKICLLTMDVGLFICEWSLKDMNGIQFCREIKENPKYQQTPFLLLSVENLKKDVILASEVGIDGYLLKPFSFEEFKEAVGNVLKARRQPTATNKVLDEAQNLLKKNDADRANQLFEQARLNNPQSARALSGLAQIAEIQNDPQKAILLLKEAHALNPDFIDAIRGLVEIFMVRGPTRELIEYTEKAHAISPENPKYTLILAKAFLEEEEFEQSEQFFKRTIRLSPKLANAYKGLGRLYQIQEDYDSAMKNFEKALDLDENDVSVLNSLGLTYVKLEKFVEGIEKYMAALKIRPSDYRIIFNLGYAKEKIGDLTGAQFYYRQALTHNPEFDKAIRR
ncbi:MAG: tetratricopeptide repeat protein, partial [Proteobacteria bacterium]|nr:tetratricopeptide repeat protein [Pseudomonadota bacterium]